MRITFECPDNWAKRIEESAHEKGFGHLYLFGDKLR